MNIHFRTSDWEEIFGGAPRGARRVDIHSAEEDEEEREMGQEDDGEGEAVELLDVAPGIPLLLEGTAKVGVHPPEAFLPGDDGLVAEQLPDSPGLPKVGAADLVDLCPGEHGL